MVSAISTRTALELALSACERLTLLLLNSAHVSGTELLQGIVNVISIHSIVADK